IVPKLSRVGVLLNPGNLANTTTLQSVESTARKLGIRVTTAEARTPAEIDSGLAAQHQQGAEAVMVLPDGLFLQRRGQIAQLAKTLLVEKRRTANNKRRP